MKLQQATIVIDNNLPLSTWLIRKSTWRQLTKRNILTFIAIVRKLERKGLLKEAGTYRIDFKALDNFDLYRLVKK